MSSGKIDTGAWDVIERELGKPSIFRSRESLTPEHVPDRLPHREDELKLLASLFRHAIVSPGSISQRILIVGSVGTGKTVLARVFGRDFTRIARSRGINIKYVHVNCHRNRTLYNVVHDIAKQLEMPVPSRGLSYKELYDATLSYLEDNDLYAIVTLDEFHYFANIAGSDAVYFIVRTYDDVETSIKRLNFIFISLHTAMLSYLDPTTESYLLRHIVKLEPYTSDQLLSILKYRAEQAFYENVVDEEVLKFVAEYEGRDRGGGGNARSALEILLRAGDYAEKEGSSKITLEHVRKAIMGVSRELVSISETVLYSPLHELLVLWAIIRVLRKTGKPFVTMGEVEREYAMLCELVGEYSRRHTQIYEYVMNLKKAGVIDAKTSGKGQRGRTTLIGVHYGPLDHFEKYVEDLVYKRLRTIRE